jgi:hypothetical protein
MLQLENLDALLPVTFAGGTTIRRFAKTCPACKKSVEAFDMGGYVGVMGDRLYISADAKCSHCQHEFPVNCLITSSKHVHPVRVPVWLFRWYLHKFAEPVASAPPSHDTVASQLASAGPDAISPEHLGHYAGQPIPAWIDIAGQRYHYYKVALPGERGLADEAIYQNLVYLRGFVFNKSQIETIV